MAGKISVNQVQLGDSSTATNNFVWQTNTDGSCKLARGNAGATTQDILTVDTNGIVTLNQGKQLTQGTAINTTSGTSHDFTSIPSWVKKITLMFNGVSTNGTSNYQIQLGAGSITSTGYASYSCRLGGASVTGGAAYSSGFGIANNTASAACSGSVVISLLGSNTWTCNGLIADSSGGNGLPVSGSIALTGTLDRVRLTTVNGTDTFDAGSINILYEG